VATLERERRNSEDPERIAVISGALEVLRDDKFSTLRQDLKLYQERVRKSEIGLMGARQEIERAMKFYVLRHKTFAPMRNDTSLRNALSSKSNFGIVKSLSKSWRLVSKRPSAWSWHTAARTIY
jgi:hypothetical protein